MKFDGVRGGVAWKAQVDFYMSSRCPLIMEMLKWAEKHGEHIVNDENLAACVAGSGLDLSRQEFVQTAIWGFLSGCVRGAALTMFKAADSSNGLDAWRRVIRMIDNGLRLHLE